MTLERDLALDTLNELDARNPDAVRLARVASVAIRIEPHLLRRLRLELVPNADVGAEGDLWFSALVESSGSSAIVLRPEAARILREHLARERALLIRALTILREAHRAAPATLQLEEDINGLALLRDPDYVERIDRALRGALITLVRNHADRALEMARWMLRAAPSFDPAVWQSGNAHALLHAAATLLRERRFVKPPSTGGPALSTLAWALPPAALEKRLTVGVQLFERAVRFIDPADEAVIDVPATNPPLVELSYVLDGSERLQLAEAVPGTEIALEGAVDSLVLRTSAGDEYRLEAMRAEAPAASPPVTGDRLLQTVEIHAGGLIQAVAALRGGRVAVNKGNNGLIAVWEPATGSLVERRGHADSVMALATMADGRLLSGSADRTVRLWGDDSPEPLRTFEGHDQSVLAVADAGSGRVISASVDTRAILWEIESGKPLQFLAGHREQVAAIAVLRDGRFALSGSYDRTLRLWDLSTGTAVRTLEGHDGQVQAVAVLPDGRYALSASADRTVKLWDLSSGEMLRTYAGHSHTVLVLAPLSNGSHFLSGSVDATLKLWRVDSSRPLRTLHGHGAQVTSIAVLPDQRAVSGSYDGTLKLWEPLRRPGTWQPGKVKVLEPAWTDDACVAIETLGSQGPPATAFYISPSRLVTAAAEFRGIPILATPDGQVEVVNARDESNAVLLLDRLEGRAAARPLSLSTDVTRRAGTNELIVPSVARIVAVVEGEPIAIEVDVRGSLMQAGQARFEAHADERELPQSFLGAPILIDDQVAGVVTGLEPGLIGGRTRLVATGSIVVVDLERRLGGVAQSRNVGSAGAPSPNIPLSALNQAVDPAQSEPSQTNAPDTAPVRQRAGDAGEQPARREGVFKRLNRTLNRLIFGAPVDTSRQSAPATTGQDGATIAGGGGGVGPPIGGRIFVSHARADRELANWIADLLERQGLKCWIAEREIGPGTRWAAEIENAIVQCALVVAVVSKDGQKSQQVIREIEAAERYGKAVLPIRVDRERLEDNLELILGRTESIDMSVGSPEDHAVELIEAVRQIVGQRSASSRRPKR